MNTGEVFFSIKSILGIKC